MIITINEAEKELEIQFAKAKDFNLRFLTALFGWYKPNPTLRDIDKELHPLIKDMWRNGYKTFDCCSGHGQRLGFIIFLPPRKRKLRGVGWETTEVIPQRVSDLKRIVTTHIHVPLDDNSLKEWLILATKRGKNCK